MTLRWQIALALAAVAAFIGAAAATGAYLTTSSRLTSSIDESLTTRAGTLASGERGGGRGDRHGGPAGRPDDPDGDTAGCPDTGLLAPATAAQLVDTSSKSVTACITGGPALPVSAADLSPGSTIHVRTVDVDGHSYRVATARWEDGEVIQLGRDLSESEQVLSSLRLKLGGIALAGVILASILGWLLARRITRPVVQLRDTAETIARTQDLGTPIPEGGAGEVGSLATSFTAMVAALGVSPRDQQQRLVDDASHEMRTPLTSLTTNLEHLQHQDVLSEGERTEVLDAVQTDVAELTHLLTELVELTTDRTGDDELVEPLDLADVARDLAARTERRSGRSVTVVAPGAPVLVAARPFRIERAIANLLDNAVKYSRAGTPIEVEVDGASVEVRDHGPGIAVADQPHVFDRFYRAVEARTEPGSGLGLAIVRQIVEGHGGQVWARSTPDGDGAAVGFRLPPASEAGGPVDQ